MERHLHIPPILRELLKRNSFGLSEISGVSIRKTKQERRLPQFTARSRRARVTSPSANFGSPDAGSFRVSQTKAPPPLQVSARRLFRHDPGATFVPLFPAHSEKPAGRNMRK